MSSSKNDESHTQDATERLKAAALTAAKGLSRAQAERAAAAAVRNVNAYGQKEEGPSRWQERKEAKRQMYLMSTEKQVRLGERKESMANVGKAVATCQKCFQPGHWTYECKNERVYISRPSRTQQLKNPKLRMKVSVPSDLDNNDDAQKEPAKKSKRKHKSRSKSESDSEASVFDSDSSSENSSGKSDLSYSSSSDSEEERRRQRKKKKQQQRKRRHRRDRDSSTSESSESETESDSDSDRGSRKKKGKKHSKRRN